jgi:hypothetical protein
MATCAPLAASDWATARPIPLLPPVINATAFLRFIFFPPLSCEPWDIATDWLAASLGLISGTATLGCPRELRDSQEWLSYKSLTAIKRRGKIDEPEQPAIGTRWGKRLRRKSSSTGIRRGG